MTPRQREIAVLVSRGFTNHEIAVAVGISINTIKKHLKQMFATLEIANRTELAALITHVYGPQ